MARDPNIPLFLWIATALLFHLTGGEGATRVSAVLSERVDVQRFADSVRRRVHAAAHPMEVTLVGPDDKELPAEPPPVDDADVAEAEQPDKQTPTSPAVVDRQAKPEKPKDDDKLPKPEPEVEKQKEPEKQKEAEKPKEQEKAPEKQDLPAFQPQNRVAVVQHVEKQDQEDNPNAEFIADDANHVTEQTQARITATDQNDPDPSPGTSQTGPSEEPGNALVNDVAQSEDSPGAIDHAPNSNAGGAKVAASVEHQAAGSGRSMKEVAPDSRHGREGGRDKGSPSAPDKQEARAEREARAGSEETLESPDVTKSRNGADSMARPAEAHQAALAQRAEERRLPARRGQANAMDFLGLGASGTTPGGINLNLTPSAALAAVGRDQLGRERALDGERRRSTHRGSFRTPGIEKWRASIENYNSSVKPGNQTALNTARVPFASYLNQIHNRLHPIFADSFLGSLNGLPSDHPLNRPDIKTNLEIVLDKDEGKIVKMGITRSSGSTVFDVAALESVQNASPFGKPPQVIVSPDGNVYLHWEFYRNPYYACSTYFARPFMLKGSPESAPPHLPPPEAPPFGPREEPPGGRGDLGLAAPPASDLKLGRTP